MALFGPETERLIRTKWKGVQSFAEEVWSLLQGDLPITQNAPVTITQTNPNDPRSPLTIDLPADASGPGITITRGSDTVTLGNFSPTDGGSGGGGGDINLGGIDLASLDWPGQDPTTSDAATPDPSDNPFTLYGVVQDQIGGNQYNVAVWAVSPNFGPSIGTIPVRQALIASDDSIPAGTPTLVLCFPGTTLLGKRGIVDAIMQVPVFVGDSSS